MSDETFDFVSVDLSDLTIGEIEELEELTDMPLDAIGDPGQKKGKLMRAMVYIAKRRENPDFTWEDAGKVKLELTDVEGDEVPLDVESA